MAAARAIIVSTAESKRASGARKSRRPRTGGAWSLCPEDAEDAAAPSFDRWRAMPPDADALVDMGSFPAGLLRCEEAQTVLQSDCGRFQEASESSHGPPVTVRVNLLSASELHPSLFAESRPPTAVLSLQGSPSSSSSSAPCHVALPATKISDGYAYWTDVALFDIPSSGDVTLTSCEEFHEPAGRAGGGGKIAWSGAGVSRRMSGRHQHPLPAGLGRSQSGRRVSPLVGPTHDEEEEAAGGDTPFPGRMGHAGPVLVVEVYSHMDRRKLLGRALVPLSPAVTTPGTPFIGTYGLERRGLLGLRKRREGQVRVIITADRHSPEENLQAQ